MYPECWEALDISQTSDIAAIKRAYAKKLKQTRPDVDAKAYQHLRECRDAALEWAKFENDWETEVANSAQQTPEIVPPVSNSAAKSKKTKPRTEIAPAPISTAKEDRQTAEFDKFCRWLAECSDYLHIIEIDAALDYVKNASLVERPRIETRLLQAIESNFEKREMQRQTHAKLSTYDAFNKAILAIDAEYFWKHRDRDIDHWRVENREHFIDRLSSLREFGDITKPPSVTAKKSGAGLSWWVYGLIIYGILRIVALFVGT